MSREEFIVQMKNEYFAFLNDENIIELRKIGHYVGVLHPTKKHKEQLIEEIVNVELGFSPYAEKGNRGAPIKAKNLDLVERVVLKIDELRRKSINLGLINPPDDEAVKRINETAGMIAVASPDFQDDGDYYSRKQVIGQLELYKGAYFLFPLDGKASVNIEELILVSLPLVEKTKVVCGDILCCHVRKKGTLLFASEILSVNNLTPPIERFCFDSEPIEFPSRKISFCSHSGNHSKTERFLDTITPVGYGQRVLAIAPNKAKRSEFLSSVVKSLLKNSIKPFVFLCETSEERIAEYKKVLPEEQLVATAYGDGAEQTVFAADFILNRVKRAAETGQDVCLVVDSLDLLARAHNRTVAACKSNELSFGLSVATLEYVKKYLATARAFQAQGSLTIFTATADFAGDAYGDFLTGELVNVANCCIYLKNEGLDDLSFDFLKSGTERGKSLFSPAEQRLYGLISDLIFNGREFDIQKIFRNTETLQAFIKEVESL